MALETVVYPQDPFSYYGFKDFYSLLGGSNWGYDLFLQQQQQQQLDQEDKSSLVGIFNHNNNNIIMDQTQNGHHDVHANWDYSSSPQPNSAQHMSTAIKDQLLGLASLMDPNSSPEAPTVFSPQPGSADPSPAAATAGELPVMGRRKRRRARSSKNKEELETQRMTHIAVERNRRKQMNEYLAILRSLMPPSYVQRGDQASIIGGAINFVKELEQFLQSMESHHKRAKRDDHDHDHDHDRDQNRVDNKAAAGLAEFFTFPQYSTRSNYNTVNSAVATENSNSSSSSKSNNNRLAEADIEVTMVDSHANLKILAKKRPRLLLKLVTGLQALGLGILHLNATTAAQMVLYSVSVKVEEGSQLNTVDEIAASVNQMLGRIQEEPVFT